MHQSTYAALVEQWDTLDMAIDDEFWEGMQRARGLFGQVWREYAEAVDKAAADLAELDEPEEVEPEVFELPEESDIELATADVRHHEEGLKMELEATIRIPVAGATMSIPTRNRIYEPGVAGGRLVDSTRVADLGSLRAVELGDGQLRIELRTGEAYAFPVAPLLNEEREAILQLRETTAGPQTGAFGGTAEKVRPHDLNLARVVSVRLVEAEPAQAPERWSKRQPIGEEEFERRERVAQSRRLSETDI
jgi:hypothetical protein